MGPPTDFCWFAYGGTRLSREQLTDHLCTVRPLSHNFPALSLIEPSSGPEFILDDEGRGEESVMVPLLEQKYIKTKNNLS